MPTVKPTKPKKGLLPTTAVGAPFSPRPVLRIPEEILAVGKDTGKVHFQFGDSPNGPETVEVNPPNQAQGGDDPIFSHPDTRQAIEQVNKMPDEWRFAHNPQIYALWERAKQERLPAFLHEDSSFQLSGFAPGYDAGGISSGFPYRPDKGGPVSMALGGTAIVGRGAMGDDPRARMLRQRRAMLNANRNVADLEQVGMARTLQNNQDRIYGQLGVSGPADIDVPQGATLNNPLVRPSIRTQGQYLADQFEEENLAADEAEYRAEQSMATRSSTGGIRPVRPKLQVSDYARHTKPAGSGEGDPDDPRVPREFIDPITGDRQMLRPVEIAMREAENKKKMQRMMMSPEELMREERDEEALRAKDQGLVPYRNPQSPANVEYLTPYEAEIRESEDSGRLKADLERRATMGQAQQVLQNLSPAMLTDMAVRGSLSNKQYFDALSTRLDNKGQPAYSPEEVQVLMKDMLKRKKEKEGSKVVQYPEGVSQEDADKKAAEMFGEGMTYASLDYEQRAKVDMSFLEKEPEAKRPSIGESILKLLGASAANK